MTAATTGQLIQQARTASGLSVDEVARAARFDPKTITRMERGDFVGMAQSTIDRVWSAIRKNRVPRAVLEMRREIGKEMRAARVRACLQQRELEQMAGVPKGCVAKIESGLSLGTDVQLRRIFAVLEGA